MTRSSKKCEKNEKEALKKLKKVGCWTYTLIRHPSPNNHTHDIQNICKTTLLCTLLHTTTQAIEAGNHEGARIYAQDAIREKNQSLNHLRMASRLDACCSRIETAVRMNQVSAGMKGVVKGMDKSLASMNIEQLSKVMDKFEAQFEDLDVKVRALCGSSVVYCLWCTNVFNIFNIFLALFQNNVNVNAKLNTLAQTHFVSVTDSIHGGHHECHHSHVHTSRTSGRLDWTGRRRTQLGTGRSLYTGRTRR